MFAKVFSQIFDSSIAESYTTRHVFMDMLVLADSDGAVDMTREAISRRTNVPLEIVSAAIDALMEPDRASRSNESDGRRLILLDEHRTWGWKIVNYLHYRQILDEESRRSYFRDYRRKERAKKAAAVQPVQVVQPGSAKFTQAEAEAEAGRGSKEEGAPEPAVPPMAPKPPTEAQVRDFISGSSTTIIPLECALRWLTDRESSSWEKPKGNHMIPVLPHWRADLTGYAMDWNERRNRANAQHGTKTHQRRDSGDLNKPGRYA